MKDITYTGDTDFENIPSLKDKALRINLNKDIYGTFAEIGAGQETVMRSMVLKMINVMLLRLDFAKC